MLRAVLTLDTYCCLFEQTPLKQLDNSTCSTDVRCRSWIRESIYRSIISVFEVLPSHITDSTITLTVVVTHWAREAVILVARLDYNAALGWEVYWQNELFCEERATSIESLIKGLMISIGFSPKRTRKLEAALNLSPVEKLKRSVTSMLAVMRQKSEEKAERLLNLKVCWFLLNLRNLLEMPIQYSPGPQSVVSEQSEVMVLQLSAL